MKSDEAAEHCVACAEALELLPARPAVLEAMDPGRLEAVRAAAQRELTLQPVARGWRREAAWLLGGVALATAGATALHGDFAPPVGAALFAADLALTLALLVGTLAAVAPATRALRLLALAGGVLSLLSMAAVRGASALPWGAHGWGCVAWVVALSLAPLAVGSFLLSGFARSPVREALLGLTSGSIGVLSLGLTCPADGALHVGVFHVGACLFVMVASVLLGGFLPRRSYAP